MSRGRQSRGGFRLFRALNMLAFLPLARRAPLYARLLWALASDPRVPNSRKLLLAGAAAYLVSPLDIVPERLPVLGALDDVAVVVLAVDVFLTGLPESLVSEKLDELGIPRGELEADLERVRRLVPAPVRRAAARIPDVFEGMASFARENGLDRRVFELLKREPLAAREDELEGRPA